MERHENERWGAYAEWVARHVFRLTKDRSTFHDARDGEGRPVEVKGCKRRTGMRGDRGKFFIREQNHRRLVSERGVYVFVVYDPTDWVNGPILNLEMKPAKWLDRVGYEWTWNGPRRDETVIRPPWTSVISESEVPSAPEGEPVATR